MVDNLRRSLAAPSSFLLAVAAWTLPSVPALLWTGLFVGSVAVPAFIPVLDGLIPRRRGISKRSHLRAVADDISVALSQTLLAITMLAYQAWLMADAVVRTLGRLYVTKRRLLEWVPAAQAGYGADLRLRASYRHLRWGVVLAALAGLLFVVLEPGAWPVATPFVLLWALSPVIAWRMSLPPKLVEAQVLSPQETRSLRLLARRTWRFFETFVDEEENALPPDNFQEDPEPVIAHRTSPTNLGLYLLSTTVAHDFGWIGILDMAKRLEDTLETMDDLRRFRGHFFNWYDTRDLRPLDPVYVSTVDSGNLAGHLIAVAQACRELMHRPLFGPEILEGIRDALELLLESEEEAEHPRRTQTVTEAHLREAAEAMSAVLDEPPTSLPEWVHRLEELEAQAENLLDIARTLASEVEEESRSEVLAWARSVRDCVGATPATSKRPSFSRVWTRPRRRRPPLGIASPPSHSAPNGWSRPWTSGSCSTPRASCSRSAIASPTARSIPAATTCWHPRRGWEASWPSPRATFRPGTGSCWAGLSRRWGAVPPSSPGRAPCSNT